MESWWRDLRYSFRTLRSRPAFTAFSTLILGLGIGLLAAVFGMTNAFLLRALPFPEPDRLVHIWQTDANTGLDTLRVSVPNFRDWQRELTSAERLGGYFYTSFSLGDSEQPVTATRMTPQMFTVLGSEPLLGRVFGPADDEAGEESLVVLSYPFWQRHFGGRRDVLNDTLLLDQEPYTIIGVLPESFVFPFNSMDVYVPLDTSSWEEQREMNGPLLVVARVRDGESLDSTQAELDTLMAGYETEYPEANAGKGANVVDLRSQLLFTFEIFQIMFPVLLAAIGFVLLIIWANIGNLFLARAIERGREVAFRITLGASRSRIIRQLMTEALVLALLGAGVGVAVALVLTRLAEGAIPLELYRVGSIELGGRGLMLVVLVSVLSAVFFGLAPALRASRADLASAIAGSGRGASEGRDSHRLRSFLVVVESAVALVLVIGALLMVRTYDALNRVDTGFDADSTVTLELLLTRNTYTEPSQHSAYFDSIRERALGLPGVTEASYVYPLPLNFESLGSEFEVPGYVAALDEVLFASKFWVGPDYFRVMQIPILDGRSFSVEDRADSRSVIVVNRQMAERYWPGESPVGRTLRIDETPREVVGVVENSIAFSLDEETPHTFYVPMAQEARRRRFLVASVEGDPEGYVQALLTSAREQDEAQTVTNARSMRRVVTTSMAPWLGAIGGLSLLGFGALLLAAMGIYGVVSFSVNARRKELAIRHALGADRGRLRNLILRESLILAGAGTGIGLVIGILAARFVRSLVFGIASVDVFTFLAAGVLLILVALGASYLPVRRVIRVNLTRGLRQE